MSYDPRCHDLAELFLSDEPALKGREAELAQLVQTTIEDWINYENRERDQLDARLDELQRTAANCSCDILHPRLRAEIERLRVGIAGARDRLERCFEPTVPLKVLPSELERAVKDAYLALRRTLSN